VKCTCCMCQGCANMSLCQVEHAGSAGPHVIQARHTDDYWRVVQLELCSCSCLPAVLVAATCTGFVQDVHTARYTLHCCRLT
jgi:hypothetical protein